MPIARCILQAVHSPHVMGIVHQDIHLGNVMAAFHKDEMIPEKEELVHFKLCLGIARLHTELAATELRKRSIMPPEVLDPNEFGPLDHRIDIYHLGLLLLQLAMSHRLEFTANEILAGKPRALALLLMRRTRWRSKRRCDAACSTEQRAQLELWRDLNSPAGTEQ